MFHGVIYWKSQVDVTCSPTFTILFPVSCWRRVKPADSNLRKKDSWTKDKIIGIQWQPQTLAFFLTQSQSKFNNEIQTKMTRRTNEHLTGSLPFVLAKQLEKMQEKEGWWDSEKNRNERAEKKLMTVQQTPKASQYPAWLQSTLQTETWTEKKCQSARGQFW